ncbi:hypothetical protein D9756_006364 [Leucocoprinus leucothites]|uniref:Cytochrome P450 n=1 Tax=Leucocoprinus leucothites TaxID=201217 RepID=A0A8H5LH35_9AGAR|nr:hypothetical protein D9756_006364 [Leucoagaricus leucothites]
MPDLHLLVALLLPASAATLWYLGKFTTNQVFPPGPRPLPVLGNILDLTTKELWLRAHEWAKQYGSITYVHIFGQDVLFLNDANMAAELLDRRGATYSGKPRLVMVGEMCGCEKMIPFTTYNDAFRRRRKLMQMTLGPRNIQNYHSGMEAETKTFLRSIVSDPSNYLRHIRRYAGGLTLSVVYGYKALSSNDPYLLLAEECMTLLSNEMAPGPGIWPVDIFPILRYFPKWLPGGTFKVKAAKWKQRMEEFIEKPWAHAKASMMSGTILPSFCSTFLEKGHLPPEEEEDVKYSANSMYAASADTTITTISHLILAMMYYPECFKKAREEIEEVVGKSRLPNFNDRASLPYLECILNETWRWGCPVPLNLPHLVTEDDIFQGKTVRKGALVIANIWAILRDEAIYPDASTFRPERFMEDISPEKMKQRDPRNYIFGFGRRRCPGADLVDSSIWLLLATMVAVIDISKPVNSDGTEFEPEIEFDNFVFRTPKAFQFRVRMRSNLLEDA